jgi:hypothetical protein
MPLFQGSIKNNKELFNISIFILFFKYHTDSPFMQYDARLACLLFKRGSWPKSFINLLAKVRTIYIKRYVQHGPIRSGLPRVRQRRAETQRGRDAEMHLPKKSNKTDKKEEKKETMRKKQTKPKRREEQKEAEQETNKIRRRSAREKKV